MGQVLYYLEVTAQDVGMDPLQDSNTLGQKSIYITAYSHVHWNVTNSGSLEVGQLVWPGSE